MIRLVMFSSVATPLVWCSWSPHGKSVQSVLTLVVWFS